MSNQKSLKLQLSGLTCDACMRVIEKRIKKIIDVHDVKIDLLGNTEILSDRQINPNEVVKVLEGTHYKVVS